MFQFIRAEVYARRASTNEKSKSIYNISDILGEALRDENHIPHVDNPKEPRYIIGSEVDIRAIPIKLAENAERFKDPVGRKMRADAALLLAGVASFPRESANNDPELYKKWEELTVDYLKNKYGATLRAVLMHDDEEHPHLHFYVYSDIEVNAKMLHDGYKNGSSPAKYKAGCKAFQDDYFEKVASHCGMARTGPKRRRLTRAEWHSEQAQSMQIALAESAVLDAASQKEKQAHSLLKTNEQHAALLAKEKRAAREAMQQALALQAEARDKIAQSEAILRQFGLSDVQDAQPQPNVVPDASTDVLGGFAL